MSWLTANDPLSALPASWYADQSPPSRYRAPLKGSHSAQIGIIGAGITGLSAALHLAQAGKDVIVLDAATAGWGASGRNGGQVGSGYNWDLDQLTKALGPREADALWTLSEDAKSLTRHLVAHHAPNADYRPGILHVARTSKTAEHAIRKTDVLRQRFPDTPIATLSSTDVANITGSSAFAAGLLDTSAGYLNPLAYTQGLARAAETAGARLYDLSKVHHLSQTAPFQISTDQGHVSAPHVILATNGTHDRLIGQVADHVLPINNYIAVTEPLGDRAPLTSPYAIVDDRFVVNYWWQSRDGRLVYGGGESYGKRFPKDIAAKVRRNLTRSYPDLGNVAFSHVWGGTLAVTTSRLPYSSELSPGLLTTGGYSGHGLALAGLAGRAMARKILGDGTEFDQLTRLPTPRLPGGRWLGPWVTGAAMMGLSLRDRLGL